MLSVKSSQCDDNQYQVALVKDGNVDKNLLWKKIFKM